jgi:FAD/FMN-containing dehydrogenase
MVVLDRRAVLRAGAATALAGAGAALTAPDAAAAAPQNIDERGWRDLANSVDGPVFRQDTANFWALNPPENHRYAQIIAAGIVCPSSPQDVARAITWASANQLPVTPRCGGHNYAGFSSTTGLLVHLGRMRDVRVDPVGRTVTVQAGARNSDIFNALSATDLLLPGGRCPSVGVSGLTLGGGIGFATRLAGLTCDNLISTTVATADGSLLTCDENTNSDLFWACRGGAGGNFGINTSFTYRLQRIPAATVYDFSWNRSAAPDVLGFFSGLIGDPRYLERLSAQFGVGTGSGNPVYGQGLFLGSPSEVQGIFDPLLRIAPPASRSVQELPIWSAMSRFYVSGNGNPYGTKSIVSARPVTGDTISRLLSHVDRFPRQTPGSSGSVSFFAMGGREARRRPGDTAYVHRAARYILSLTAYWGDTDYPEVRDGNLAWLDSLYQDMAGRLGTSAYQNFPDGELRQWWSAYYGDNYARLVQVKQKYDPNLLFRYPQGIRANPGS